MRRIAGRLAVMLALLAGAPACPEELAAIEGCRLVPADWADGDSFRIRTATGEEHTIRLYGVDCLEHHVSGETDARRLRSQRRYFGITEARPEAAASVEFAKQLAAKAMKALPKNEQVSAARRIFNEQQK